MNRPDYLNDSNKEPVARSIPAQPAAAREQYPVVFGSILSVIYDICGMGREHLGMV